MFCKFAGFFVSFGEESPKKAKPKLGNNRKKDDKKGKQKPETDREPEPVIGTPVKEAPPSPPRPPVNVSPGVGFIVGENDEETGASVSIIKLPYSMKNSLYGRVFLKRLTGSVTYC